MKIQEIQLRIAEIKTSAGDYEAAHALEDKLYQDLLQYIADKGGILSPWHIRDLARAALKAKDIKFDRYTA